jgi:subtilisin family serine protease
MGHHHWRTHLAPLILASTALLQTPAAAGEIAPNFAAYLDAFAADEEVSAIVNLRDQVDIEELKQDPQWRNAPRQVRHERVIRSLRELADRTQTRLRAHLDQAQAAGQVVSYSPHWISNLIVLRATKAEILRLARHPDVELIEENFQIELIEPIRAERGSLPPHANGIGITPGVKAIHADRVWKEMGITGAGRLVANLDTGVDGNHPALSARWRGTEPGVDPSAAWLDLVYGGTNFPADHYGHGTHVMGTMTGLGQATGDTVGVAFGAQWIACNAVDQDAGPEFDNDVVVAFEWLADPDGDPGTVDDVPDVVQNSWGINENFSSTPPYTDCDSRWWAVIDNCEAAGCVVTYSAGNEGPGPHSLRSPSDRATTPYNAFSIGAVDATNAGYPYPSASFSSRGPSGCDDISIKPEVCAPGVDVYSSVPGGGYESGWSGTSMAGPHVAGVVALMREANPQLTVDQIKEVLMRTSHDFGSVGEDNTYGMGFIDAYEAVLMVMDGVGYLAGHVTAAESGDPLPAEVEIVGTSRHLTADPVTGFYYFILPGDTTYTVAANYFGREEWQQDIYVAPDDTTFLDIAMDAAASGQLAGMVMDHASGLPVDGASVALVGTPMAPVSTNEKGIYSILGVPAGATYTVQATAANYGSNSETRAVTANALNLLALPLMTGLSDQMENGTQGWSHSVVTPGYKDQWHQATSRNHTPGGTTSWKCGSIAGGGLYGNKVDAGLATDPMLLPANSKLQFWHWMAAETETGTTAWDGAIVEISVNGGSFQQITPEGGYPYIIVSNIDSPFDPGTPCFSGHHDWEEVTFDLSAYSGNVSFRFRFGTDGYVIDEGWYIDDLMVAPDAPADPVSVMLLPIGDPVVIGPAGGSFDYHLGFVNNTRTTQSFDWWFDVSLADGTVVLGPLATHHEMLAAGATLTFGGRTQEVPAGEPAGSYHINAKVGTPPSSVDAISSFSLTVTE